MKASRALFVSKEGTATFWFLLAAGAVIATFFYTRSIVLNAGLRPQFIIMTDPDVRPMLIEQDPAREAEIVADQTRLAMDSIFNKTGSGLDSDARCRHLLARDAWDWVKSELLDKQADVFRESRMHQKVEIEKIELHPQDHEDATLASVQGQLLRVGIYGGKVFDEVWAVHAELMWTHNPSLRTLGRQPLVCSAFTCRETPVASTLRRAAVASENDSGAPAAPGTPAPESTPN